MCGTFAKEYCVPWWASLLNSFPRLDLTFQKVNSTFDLNEPKYKESLIFWIAPPILWLLITLLLFLVYFCYRCCQNGVEKKQNVSCLKWTMAILALISCGAIGVGFYANEETNKGIVHLSIAANDAMDIITRMKVQMLIIQKSIDTSITEGINRMTNVYRIHSELNRSQQLDLYTLTERALQYAKEIATSLSDINHEANRIDFSHLKDDINVLKEYNFYRRIGMLMVLGWLLLLCLILLIGVGSSSKCTLLLFCAFGILSLVACYVSTGIHLGTSIGFSDFCVEPHPFIFGQLASAHMDLGLVQYYIRCDSNAIPNPFKEALQSASDSIKQSNSSLNGAAAIAYSFLDRTLMSHHVSLVYSGLDESTEALLSLTALIECTNFHEDYVNALQGICYIALPGMLLLILSTFVTGLFISILVVLASKAWKNFGSEKSYIEQEEEEEGPFLPLPNNSSPSYYRYGLVASRPSSVHDDHPSFPRAGRSVTTREQISMQTRNTPPPAYNSNEFYRQYSDVNPPDDDRRSGSNA